jgi:hypothetical protein
MTGTNCDLFTHKSSRSYLNHFVYRFIFVLPLEGQLVNAAEENDDYNQLAMLSL